MSAVTSSLPGHGATGAPSGRRLIDGWMLACIALAGLVALPLLTIVYRALAPTDDIWPHLARTVLPVYAGNTLILLAGVATGTILLGTSTAWLVTMYRFPGRRLLTWALLLPLAVPSYILAFVITDQLEYAGPVQQLLRDVFGWQSARDYWFPEVRSIGGATVVLSLVLYPYVYLLARAAFLEQCFCLFEASRTLGRSATRSFLKVALPMARPAIAVGVALASMETLNEYGTVEFFAVPTFTAGIFDVWQNMDSTSGAAQLACILVVFTLVMVTLERLARRKRRYHHTTSRVQALPEYSLSVAGRIAAMLWCALPVLAGFVLPAWVLSGYALEFGAATLSGEFLGHAWNSIRLAAITAVVAAAVGIVLAYGVRLSASPWMRAAAETASVGYAIPGAVLAVGIMIPLGTLDNALDAGMRSLLGVPVGLALSASGTALVVGYVARFMALSYRTVDASLARVTPNMEGAARTLGATPWGALRRVHLPLIRPSVLTAALLVFVDTMKELPLTLILRPFNFETLATFVYQYASEELLEECSLAALTIVLVGVAPVLVLSRTIARSRPGQGRRA
jgi:iron(III) transport system permease protein